ncbi:hypothetical protein [Anditalea andensis]|uniref:Uncharacterized protein n=1 Tax=Anditalea andensis TaxID=1048983 RepID=A0A074L110_9BACT|nr:hypothetical protein [Anditalea andensis]KEO74849.1 hypothetical protein EL17_04000 [Anditalea andensis]
MKNINSILYITSIAGLGLAACSPGATALRGETDDLYFMASDAAVATEYAVQNNTPNNFREIKQADPEQLHQENFSAKNVNPEYIARYQRQEPEEEGSVYFDESGTAAGQGEGDVNVYNNFYGAGAGNQFNRGFGMNPWMMGGFGMMNPWMNPMMMGGFGMMNPMMMGGFYDPFWGPGFGMRGGFGMSVGLGFGFNRFGMGFGSPWMMGSRFGMMGMGFYDPFWGPGFGMMGMHPMMGWGYGGFGRPIFVLPGGEFGQRQVVRGARVGRGAGVATPGQRTRAAATPTASRAAARREAVGRTSTPTSRVRSNDFNRSQNDLYSDRARTAASAAPSRRAANSPAMNRAGSATNRNAYTAPRNTSGARAQSPASRTAAPTNRTAAPARSTSPSYNRSTSPAYNRTSPTRTAPAQRSAPTQRSTPSYSAPSRGGSVGGGSRGGGGSVGGGSRGGGRGGR